MSADAITTVLELTDYEATALMAVLGNVPEHDDLSAIYLELRRIGFSVDDDVSKASLAFQAQGIANALADHNGDDQ